MLRVQVRCPRSGVCASAVRSEGVPRLGFSRPYATIVPRPTVELVALMPPVPQYTMPLITVGTLNFTPCAPLTVPTRLSRPALVFES